MGRSKKCFKCKIVLPLREFYKHPAMVDGHLNKCKSCTRKDVKKNRQNNLERIRAYDRERAKNPERKKRAAEYLKIWRKKDFNRGVAHSKVYRALQNKTLKKGKCEKCGAKKVVAHHDDYTKPLVVRWLCQPCHITLHKRKNK